MINRRSNSPRPRLALLPESAIAVVLILLGLMVTSGWLVHVPMMVEIKSGLLPMVFNTGLCFLLAGVALQLMRQPGATPRRVRQSIGGFLILLCTATFIEFLLDRNLGIDLASLHAWYDYGNKSPGRMAPNTALGFILAGSVIVLTDRVDRKQRAVAVVVITFALLAIGLTGLAGYLLAPDLLFGWARSARMALHTATGMILCAVGLWLAWSRRDWYLSRHYFREDDKIRFLGAAILAVVSITVGLVGFVLLQNSLQTSLESGLEVVVRNRASWFKLSVDDARRHAASVSRLSGLDEAGRAALAAASTASQRADFQALAERVIGEQYHALGLQDAAGTLRQSVGQINLQPQLEARLDAAATVALVWDRQMLLRTRIALRDGERIVGQIVLDEPAPLLEKTLFNSARLGLTGEIAACIVNAELLLCYPGTRHTAPFTVERRSKKGVPLPMELAIVGASGIIHAIDYRANNVVAAYGPLAPGLGFVAKQDATEIYGVIRAALVVGAPIVLAIAMLGVILLYSQLEPLATGLWASELAASEKELEIRIIMDAAGDGILTTDRRGRIQSINPAACRIFGYDASELGGVAITCLMPAELQSAQLRSIAERAGAPLSQKQIDPHNIEVVGTRKNGARFPLELTINAVPRSGCPLYVGVVRDITERKEAEQRLSDLVQYDALTGLPNRSLFMDRLDTALLRCSRSHTAVALMFLDLDGFKQINDTYGHQAGDELLIQFAHRLSALVRKTDTVARFAGDEFTVVLELLAQARIDAKSVAKKIVDSMQRPFVVTGHEVSVTVSIGVVIHDGDSIQIGSAELLRNADNAMYRAKHAGKNVFRMA